MNCLFNVSKQKLLQKVIIPSYCNVIQCYGIIVQGVCFRKKLEKTNSTLSTRLRTCIFISKNVKITDHFFKILIPVN